MLLKNDVLETLKKETASFKFIINLSEDENAGCRNSCSGGCSGSCSSCSGSCSGSCTSCAGRCVGYLD